jgi:GH15 family glucan-1,4-alpha-glucosidase
VNRANERDPDGYLPIASYGLIGDCRSAALVSVDGSIDWLCLPRFDDEALFARILDSERGGCWQICPSDAFNTRQRYRDLTNILDTVYTTDSGVVVVTDFMPVDENDVKQHARLHKEPRVIRLVECISGEMRLRHVFHPAPNFGRERPRFEVHQQHVHADSETMHICLVSSFDLPEPDAAFTIRAGDAAAFALRVGKTGHCSRLRWSSERARSFLRTTQEYWWRWVGRCQYGGPYMAQVRRSALALKLMTYSPTGAIVAAPTTSLPEWIGGSRNWDYRFTWLRDASFTLFALFQLGLHEEAEAFFHWLAHRHLGEHADGIPNLFDLNGHAHNEEIELTHLAGYRGSKPVRIGNGATRQLQLDVYGEVLDSAYVYARFGRHISQELWKELHAIVDIAIERWQEPDSSIWEVRRERAQYTYSKLMCWVAVDRGLRLAERYRLPHESAKWKSARRAMRRLLTTEAYSTRRGAFTQIIGNDALDSALLRLSQVRFLPDRDPRVLSTIKAIERELSEGVLVRRYRVEESADGLTGDEGAFFLTSFWMADALAHIGDLEGAQRRFERLLVLGAPLGLFAEEADPRSGELLGNYPQAFTHLALVGAAVNIERARTRQLGVRGLRAPEQAVKRAAAGRAASA